MTDLGLRTAMRRLADEWGITAGGSADFAEQIRDDGAGTFAIEFMLTLNAEHPDPEPPSAGEVTAEELAEVLAQGGWDLGVNDFEREDATAFAAAILARYDVRRRP